MGSVCFGAGEFWKLRSFEKGAGDTELQAFFVGFELGFVLVIKVDGGLEAFIDFIDLIEGLIEGVG